MKTHVDHEWEYYEDALNQILSAALAAGRSEEEAASLARTSRDIVTRRLADDHFVQLLDQRRDYVELAASWWRRDPVSFLRFVASCELSSSPLIRQAGITMHLDWIMDQPDEEGRLQAIGLLLSPPHSHGPTGLPGSDQE